MPDLARDPRSTGRFVFEVQGLEIGRFTEVSGLSVEVDVESVSEGGENEFVHKLPGRMTWPNVVLKRGITNSDNLLTWLTESSGYGFASHGNKLSRRTASLTLLRVDGERDRVWSFVDAFAVKWRGPTFAATGADAAIEELEIAHHGFRSGASPS